MGNIIHCLLCRCENREKHRQEIENKERFDRNFRSISRLHYRIKEINIQSKTFPDSITYDIRNVFCSNNNKTFNKIINSISEILSYEETIRIPRKRDENFTSTLDSFDAILDNREEIRCEIYVFFGDDGSDTIKVVIEKNFMKFS